MAAVHWDQKLLAGLKALAESSFPKRCANCGAVYQDVDDYVRRTAPVSAARSGLKQSSDDDGHTIVELFRNCTCGSTLMDFFDNRRDLTDAGARRRQRFDELRDYLASTGLDPALVHAELQKLMRGESSTILAHVQRKTDD
jgi:predicted  nucleic acid-binding Zn-ribbon protein